MAREPQDWRVEFAPAAIRALDRLPTKIAAAVVEFVTTSLPTNPRRMSKPLRPPLEEWRVARRGDYRVIIQLDEVAAVILVGRIEHRAHAYRRR
ncbi:type II toxin-antitoxin system mRNA interferase RelE [Georgenia halophila]|uniref:Type II toxin-antitoxin system mRNA interferase RelE n=1 Tax=Georgenia halophila TaxID=620889 RepID=A0ABP8L331_9MICO